ncbi:MAG: phosphoribosylformylglycinamidine cyclo-ligase [Gammaproteobacteria bacterium]|nr:phosphoribosylformylglycinamidine cyclo-ligase [Gammaproteobacteria bacterium]MCH9744512.1 phosphoribosylformylglycinamidine cyclo-ligase [Gammaproteobacteria bacterium]
MKKQNLSYKDAGVNIEQADKLVTDIKNIAKKTDRPGTLSSIGGFGALFEIPEHYRQPVLVSGTDGVGTKLKLAINCNDHAGIGIDLVAMCANDILCQGAEPLYFLDYFATGQLNPEQAKTIITSIGQGCEQAGAALIGGETAEMPGLYQKDEYDLAGFCVGVVEKSNIIDGSQVQAGDCLIGIASSGPHANGYSLIRKILENEQIALDHKLGNKTLAEILLAPTKIYVKPVLSLLKAYPIHALAHITGGGLLENIPRVLPQSTQATIDPTQWQKPEIFDWLQQQGNVEQDEMFRTFNMGIGMTLITAKEHADDIINQLKLSGETAWVIGEISTQTTASSTANAVLKS